MKLKEYLSQQNQSAASFAAQHGFSRSTFYKWFYGLRQPRLENMEKIEAATNGLVTAQDFLSPTKHTGGCRNP